MKVYLLMIDYDDEGPSPVAILSSLEKVEEFQKKYHLTEDDDIYAAYVNEFKIDFMPDIPEGGDLFAVWKNRFDKNWLASEMNVERFQDLNQVVEGEYGAVDETYVIAKNEEEAIEKGRKILESFWEKK